MQRVSNAEIAEVEAEAPLDQVPLVRHDWMLAGYWMSRHNALNSELSCVSERATVSQSVTVIQPTSTSNHQQNNFYM